MRRVQDGARWKSPRLPDRNTIHELDAMALTCGQPEQGLVRGDGGTAMLGHGNGAVGRDEDHHDI